MSGSQQLLLGGKKAADAVYVEDVFSTYLYTGNGSTQTITNGIDLAGKGGLVWIKGRTSTGNNYLQNTVQTGFLSSNSIASSSPSSLGIPSFNSDGFNIDIDLTQSGVTYASWAFRKQPKFFDVVTYTGNGNGARSISHNLGSIPGFIAIKAVSTSGSWRCAAWNGTEFRRGLANLGTVFGFNSTSASDSGAGAADVANATTFQPFGVVASNTDVNDSGVTYVAYLFAHNAGGFGLTGTDNVISCGSYTGNGSTTGPVVSLGYEPQWLMVKNASQIGQWEVYDSMRGLMGGVDSILRPNTNGAEVASVDRVTPTATGFYPSSTDSDVNASGDTYIYVAIRRGPMKVPTSGASVFDLVTRSGTGVTTSVTGGTGVTDLAIVKNRSGNIAPFWASRLAGINYLLSSGSIDETAAPTAILPALPWDLMSGYRVGSTSSFVNASGVSYVNYMFTRAAGFFDQVRYTGIPSEAQPVNHNLQAVPELIICKKSSGTGGSANWIVFHKDISPANYLILNSTSAVVATGGNYWVTLPTAQLFYPGYNINSSGVRYTAYLFASCPGVSKVGKYTGTSQAQTIDCGFVSGARFVLIKRADAVGSWYVYDTARGINVGNDPYFFLNTTAPEVTIADEITPQSVGFGLSAASSVLNQTGATYIFLAIA